MRKVCMMLLVVAILSLGVTQVFAANLNPTPEKPVTLRLGYSDNPTWPDTAKVPEPEHAYGIIFKSFVETATNGAIKVELFPSSQMGGSKEATEMVKTGTLDLCIETGNMGPFFPEFPVWRQLSEYPWLETSGKNAKCLCLNKLLTVSCGRCRNLL